MGEGWAGREGRFCPAAEGRTEGSSSAHSLNGSSTIIATRGTRKSGRGGAGGGGKGDGVQGRQQVASRQRRQGRRTAAAAPSKSTSTRTQLPQQFAGSRTKLLLVGEGARVHDVVQHRLSVLYRPGRRRIVCCGCAPLCHSVPQCATRPAHASWLACLACSGARTSPNRSAMGLMRSGLRAWRRRVKYRGRVRRWG